MRGDQGRAWGPFGCDMWTATRRGGANRGALTITTYISLIVSWVSRKRGHSLLLLFCYVMWCDTYISIFLIAYKLMRVFYNKIIYSTVQPTGWWPKHRLYLSPQPFHTAQYCIYLLLYFQYFCLFCHMIISFWEAPSCDFVPRNSSI